MSELASIKHIDLGIHFDYMRSQIPNRQMTQEAAQRFQRCRARIAIISERPDAAMFYFSIFLTKDEKGKLVKDSKTTDIRAYNDEMLRVREYQEMLGSRFFLFAGLEQPSLDSILPLLKQRGYTYYPEQTTLLAYGEWLDACVSAWSRHIKRTMGLNEMNCGFDPKLSLSFNSDELRLKRDKDLYGDKLKNFLSNPFSFR